MSKWKSKFSSVIESLKKPLGKVKKSQKSESDSDLELGLQQPEADSLIDSMEWDEESQQAEFDADESHKEEEYQEEYEDDFDETNPSFSTLTIGQIRQNQIDNGEAPPDIPDEVEHELSQEDDHSFEEEENDFEVTNPAMREYTPKKSLFAKLKAKKPTFSSLSASIGIGIGINPKRLLNPSSYRKA